jgi:hypothetical protein
MPGAAVRVSPQELRDLVDEALGCGDPGQVAEALQAAEQSSGAGWPQGLAAGLDSLKQYARSLSSANDAQGVFERMQRADKRRRASISLAREAMSPSHAPSISDKSQQIVGAMDRRGSIVDRLAAQGQEAAKRQDSRRATYEQQILRNVPEIVSDFRPCPPTASQLRQGIRDALPAPGL